MAQAEAVGRMVAGFADVQQGQPEAIARAWPSRPDRAGDRVSSRPLLLLLQRAPELVVEAFEVDPLEHRSESIIRVD